MHGEYYVVKITEKLSSGRFNLWFLDDGSTLINVVTGESHEGGRHSIVVES